VSQSATPIIPKELFPSLLPAWADADLLNEWLQHRKELRKKPTPTAVYRMMASLQKAHDMGHDPMKLLAESIERGWQAPYIPKHPPQEKSNAAADRSRNGHGRRLTRSERLAQQCEDYLAGLNL
jgi:hypothetical protein